jgi:hypothetical protein
MRKDAGVLARRVAAVGVFAACILVALPAYGQIITNPLGPGRTLASITADFIAGLRTIAIPIVVILVIYGGFQIMTAGGNPQKFEDGKKTLLYTGIGLAVILLAETIAAVIRGIIEGS